MKPKLTDRSIRYAIRQLEKGRSTKVVAEELNVTQRHIQRLWAEYRNTGTVHVQRLAVRPTDPAPSEREILTVLDIHSRKPEGVVRTFKRLRKEGHDISRYRTYGIMKSKGLAADSTAKTKQRKWVRYERIYSNAMWHTDWHAMKDPRVRGLSLIPYLDDASRCVTGAALFKEATSVNAVAVLRQAISRFGAPATVLSGNGSGFVGRGGRKKQTGHWTTIPFESELLSLDIGLINSRPYHPQTNGKLERLHGELQRKVRRFEDVAGPPGTGAPIGAQGIKKDPAARFIHWYNYERPPESLDWDRLETPAQAFVHKKPPAEEAGVIESSGETKDE